MTYRHDPALEFLGQMQSRDLDDLVYCLTHDKDGEVRFTETLTSSEPYKRYHPDHKKYWQLVAAELQCFGANSFATLFRGGRGVEYKEILTDVCNKVKVNYNKYDSVENIEGQLLGKIFSDAVAKMTPEELKTLASELGIDHKDGITPELMVASFQTIFKLGGFKSYKLTLIVVNWVWRMIFGKGLTLVANASLMRALGMLTGPIGWAITGVWTVVDIAGAAYRVTIPAVIQVALLRQHFLCQQQGIHIPTSLPSGR